MQELDLIGWLTERQIAEGLSDREMAARLVYTDDDGRERPYKRAGWNRLRLRQARVSLRLVQAACRAYPEHRDLIRQLTLPDCAA